MCENEDSTQCDVVPSSVKGRRGADGFVLGYLLFALAMLSLVVVYTGRIFNTQDQAKWIAASKDKLEDQINLILSQLSICASLEASDSEVDFGAIYPDINSDGSDRAVKDLTCPATSATIWDTSIGTFPLRKVSGFNEWMYHKTADVTSATIYVYITADDKLTRPVFVGLQRRFGPGQVSLSSTSSTDDTLQLYILKPQ